MLKMFTLGRRTLSISQSLQDSFSALKAAVIPRQISFTPRRYQEEGADLEEEKPSKRGRPLIPHVDVETSMRYMKSNAYKEAYGNRPVWAMYRRNYKGNIKPPTRESCIVGNKITAGNPCPICRDHYLVVDYRNMDLIEQFLEPNTTQVIDTMKTGICQRQYKRLINEVSKAVDYGLLESYVPFREYDQRYYAKLASQLRESQKNKQKNS